MMKNMKRSAIFVRSKYRSLLEFDSVLGFTAAERTAIVNSTKKLPIDYASKEMLCANNGNILYGKEFMVGIGSQFQVTKMCGASHDNPYFARSFASKPSQQIGQEASQAEKKRSTFGLSSSDKSVFTFLMLVAAAIGYPQMKYEAKKREIFNAALVTGRIGSPVTGYDMQAQKLPFWQRMEDGVPVCFKIRGSHGSGKVSAKMFKDEEDEEWKYRNLKVQITQLHD